MKKNLLYAAMVVMFSISMGHSAFIMEYNVLMEGEIWNHDTYEANADFSGNMVVSYSDDDILADPALVQWEDYWGSIQSCTLIHNTTTLNGGTGNLVVFYESGAYQVGHIRLSFGGNEVLFNERLGVMGLNELDTRCLDNNFDDDHRNIPMSRYIIGNGLSFAPERISLRNGRVVTPTSVPEPSSFVCLLLGFSLLAGLKGRYNRK